LKPFQSLVWFLSNTLGMSVVAVVFTGLFGNDLPINPNTSDQLFLVLILFALPIGFFTSLPLKPFLKEALRRQNPRKETSKKLLGIFSGLG